MAEPLGWFITRVATALVVSIAVGTAPGFAQTIEASSDAQRTLDPSELTPAPSTWKGAITDSFRLLLLEHTMRVAFQDNTRRELGGPFFSDYFRSVRMPQTWEDGGSWGVNYVGHPIHGAAAGFIWLDHEDGAHDPKKGSERGSAHGP